MAEPSPASRAADPKALLGAANSASEKVAALHIVFLAICAYILVIVFGTSDVDLLIGKGVKLPVVDVEVPIVGFYASAPYLLVLVHFNLLLSLQLLSRKLYAFDDAARESQDGGGLHDQLNIFPYNHYLIGRPGRLVGGLIALVVTITMLLLPLAALLTLQARFLAYQSEAVTWAQRLAVWLDLGLLVVLWPVIMDRRDSWRSYMRAVWGHARLHWLGWAWGAAGFLIAVLFLERNVLLLGTPSLPPPLEPKSEHYLTWLTDPWWFYPLAGWLVLTLFTRPLRYGARWLGRGRYRAPEGGTHLVSGATGLLAVLLLGLPLSMILVTAGEKLGRPAALSTRMLAPLRHLNLREKVLLAKPLQPELLADLRGSDPDRMETALRSVQRLELRDRSLRMADFSNALLPKADLRGANLQGAYVFDAHLPGADLTGAQLQGAFFVGTMLNGANLSKTDLRSTSFVEVWLESTNLQGAQMQGTLLNEVSLRGANLRGANLQGTDLSASDLVGAYLSRAHLEAADLRGTPLHGANLSNAQLQGANLPRAQLRGVVLSGANLLGASLQDAVLYTDAASLDGPVDARGLKWQPLSAEEVQPLRGIQGRFTGLDKGELELYKAAFEKAVAPGLKASQFKSCLRDKETQVECNSDLPLAQLRALSLEDLEKLACELSDTARSFIRRQPPIEGLALRLQNRAKAADDKPCWGLKGLSAEDKARLSALASGGKASRP